MTQTTSICRWLTVMASLGLLLAVPGAPSCAEEISAELRKTATVRAIQEAAPAVVNIEGKKPANAARPGDSQQVNGMGAGVIVDSRGYILTNQHVVQDVGRIEVTLHNGRQYVGRMIDRDQNTDLALIKIDAGKPLPVIRCGTSSDLMLGEPVIAIGNPYGYHHTVTEGIISALKRDVPVNGVDDYPALIQTDASINPGNSGGPLLNAAGDMIGINAAVRIGAQGIGFTIPVDRAIEVAAEMIARYRGSNAECPIAVHTTFQDGTSLVRVADARSDATDLTSGDCIRAVNRHPIHNRLDFELALLGHTAGTVLDIDVQRTDGSQGSSKLTLNSRGAVRAQLASTSSAQSVVYEKFGLRLEPADAARIQAVDASYSGGLRVVSVRQNSPAYKAQIRVGDNLVGLLEWQTPHWDDLSWIMERPELRNSTAPKFHIMRGKDVFWGTLELGNSVAR